MFSAFLQMYTYDIATAVNQTSPASPLRLSLELSPSSKSPARRTGPVTETTTLRMFHDISDSPKSFKTSVVLMSSIQTTWIIVKSSRGTNTSTIFMEKNESSAIGPIGNTEGENEDHSAVFYRKVSSVYWELFHYFLTRLSLMIKHITIRRQ